MKDFIASYLIDVVDDDYAETGLTESQINEATKYIWQNFDFSEIYEQLDRLLSAYLATK